MRMTYFPATGPWARAIVYRPPLIAAPASVAVEADSGTNWIEPDGRGLPSRVTSPETASRGRLSVAPPPHPVSARLSANEAERAEIPRRRETMDCLTLGSRYGRDDE